jgi:hypothetical protein
MEDDQIPFTGYVYYQNLGDIHKISSHRIVENEAGSDAFIYNTFCGKEVYGWYYVNSPTPVFTGSLIEALESNQDICKDCFGTK